MTTRMDTRVEHLEKGMEDLRATVHALDADVHNLHNGLQDIRTLMGELVARLDGPPPTASPQTVPVADPVPLNAAPPAGIPPGPLSTLRRLDLPIFNGNDPVGWVARMEQYLDIMDTPTTAKVASAMVAMDGRVLHWVRYFFAKNPIIPWKDFASAILQRYGGHPRLTSYEAWVTTRQEGSIDDYIDVFLARRNQIEGLSEPLVLAVFLGGLQPEIRNQIRSRDATSLDDTMQLAREIEDDLSRIPRARVPWAALGPPVSQSLPPKSTTPQVTAAGAPYPANPSPPPHASPSEPSLHHPDTSRPRPTAGGVCTLSHSEYLDLRAKGLCYRCHKPYSPLHQCPNKSLQIMMLIDDDDASLEPSGEAQEPDPPMTGCG